MTWRTVTLLFAFTLLSLLYGSASADSQSSASEIKEEKGKSDTDKQSQIITQSQDLLKTKHFAQAIKLLSKELEDTPLSAPLHLWRGNLLWSICDYRAAIKDFDAAINQNHTSADAFGHKAICLARLGLYDQAVENFKAAATRQTNDPAVILMICRALFEHKDYQEAIDYLKDFDQKAENLKAESEITANIYLTRAQSLAALGDATNIDLAIKDLKKAMTIYPSFPLAYLAMARINQKLGQYEEALANARKALELKKNKFALAHLIAGECQLPLGKLDEADHEILTAIQETGRVASGEAQHYKALIIERRGNFLSSLPDRALALQLGYLDPPPLTIIGHEVLSTDPIFSNFASVVAGDHFLCYSDIGKDKLQRYAAIAEGLALYAQTHVCPLQGDYPGLLFILRDKSAEQSFLRDHMDFNGHVHGVFLGGRNSVVTYDGAGIETFLHEVMHKFLYNPRAYDYWADEGIACFFGKSYGYLYKGSAEGPQNLFLDAGYPDSNILSLALPGHRPKLSLIVISSRYADPSKETAQRLVALFVAKYGKLQSLLDLSLRRARGPYKYFIEAAFDKPLSDLDALFESYLENLDKNRIAISKLPPAEIFDSQGEYDQFIKNHSQAFSSPAPYRWK